MSWFFSRKLICVSAFHTTSQHSDNSNLSHARKGTVCLTQLALWLLLTWWHIRSQGISSNGSDQVLPYYFGHNTRRINTLRPRQNGRHFTDDTFKHIFLKENVRILIEIPLKFVPKSPIDNIPALFQIMAWRRPGDKPLSEAMMVSLLMHICVARPQWVNWLRPSDTYMNENNIPTLFQIMACHLFGTKPSSEPKLQYCQLDPKEHISAKFYLKFKCFHSRKCTWTCRLQNGSHFVLASMC